MKSNSKIHMYYTEGSQRARDYVGFNGTEYKKQADEGMGKENVIG